MNEVLSSVWALLLGIVLIMLGNGMHFTLIGLRGGIEGFTATELAVVTSGYFAGFLSGARYAPVMIRRVGHVRVFAALGSFMSAGLIAFPILTDPLRLDAPSRADRVLYVRDLRDGRKLAERRGHQRDPR